MTRLKKYNTAKLKVPEVVQSFKIELQNRFSCLADDEANNRDDHVQDVENDWKKIKHTYQKTAENVLGFQSRSSKPWISAEKWKKMDESRELKRKISEGVREQLRNAYSTKNKEVKRQLKEDKNDWAEKVAKEAQKAAEQGLKQFIMLPGTRLLPNRSPAAWGTQESPLGS